jgi:NTP pyrophosphatase (non-canonical NTP hydrolase)
MTDIDKITSLEEFISANAEITASKGFNTSDHFTQLLLFASEIQEAMEHCQATGLGTTSNRAYMGLWDNFYESMDTFRAMRKTVPCSCSVDIVDENKYLEEIADIFIRLMSYSAQFKDENGYRIISIIQEKMQKNANREVLHGNKF